MKITHRALSVSELGVATSLGGTAQYGTERTGRVESASDGDKRGVSRRLASQHSEYAQKLDALEALPHLTDQEQMEETRLKKMKLRLKDQMEAIMSQYRSQHRSLNISFRCAQRNDTARSGGCRIGLLILGPMDNPDEPVRIPVTDVFDLHSVPPRDVRPAVEAYLEEAHPIGLKALRIIHGRGIGVQREIVRAVLARTPFVLDFRDAPAEAGGWGATVITLR